MSQVTEIYCDVCGIKKGATNHWTYAQEEAEKNVTCLVFFYRKLVGIRSYDLCSDQCCGVVLQRWLSERKAKADAAVTA